MKKSLSYNEPTVLDLLNLIYIKSRFTRNSIVYGYFSDRSRNEIARRLGLSPYKVRTIVNRLIVVGLAKRQGMHLVLPSYRAVRKRGFTQLTKHFTKHNYRYCKTDYKNFLDKGYCLILSLNKANQEYAQFEKEIDRLNTKSKRLIARLHENLQFNSYFSVRSVARLLGVSRTKAQAILKRLNSKRMIITTVLKECVATIPLGVFDLYRPTLKGYAFCVRNRDNDRMVDVYEHNGMSIEFLA